ELMSGLAKDAPFVNAHESGAPYSQPYRGQPYFVSEFGGIWWDPEAAAAQSGEDRTVSWGYGERVRGEDEFHERFAGLTEVLLGDRDMFGYCYTQLTDVFQEQNGIYRFDRGEKLDVARVRAAQLRPAAIEEPEA
ncbi:beta-galactosidase, partial [Streptomyces sp. SID5926]|nr:beta-galactosidase [Streptomyces sp. SID5926]